MEEESMFCGQLSSVYLFSEALMPGHVASMYALGPAYKVTVLKGVRVEPFGKEKNLNNTDM